MKNLFISISACVLVMILLAGCHSIQSAGHTSSETQTPTAVVINAGVMQVPLDSFFNNVGITRDDEQVAEGLDNGGCACSATLLGKSQVWNETPFHIGSVGSSNVVTTAGQTIPLPAGKFSALRLLMVAVNGNQESQNFLITYVNGAVQTNTQSLSDWFTPAGYPGESQALIMNYRNQSDGTKDEQIFYVYGYSFKLDKTQAVASVTLPDNSNVKVLAMTLVP